MGRLVKALATGRTRLSSLFSPIDPPTGWQWANPALFVLGTIVMVLRVPADTRFVLWAEDGNTFLAQAYDQGGGSVFFAPYAGYMHLIPRVTAWIVRDTVDLPDSGIAMALAAAAVTSLCLVGAFHWSRGWLSAPAAVVLWLATLLMPASALELALNVADSHWWLMYAAFWALLSRLRGPASVAAASVAVVAAALSDPLTAVLVPLALIRAAGWTTKRDVIAPVALLIGLAGQMLVVQGASRSTAVAKLTIDELIHQAIVRLGFATVVGGELGDRFAMAHPFRAAIVGAGVLIGILVASAVVVRRRPIAVIALVHALVWYSLIEYLVWPNTRMPTEFGPLTWGQRYAFNALLLLAVAVVAIADAAATQRRAPVAGRILAGVIAVALLWPGITQFQSSTYRRPTPTLDAQLPAAIEACRLDGSGMYPFVILPTELYTWPVACSVILSTADG